jgi:hypothetical protein
MPHSVSKTAACLIFQTVSSTTVTVNRSAWCWRGLVGSGGVKDRAEAVPDTGTAPVLVAAVGGVPRAVGRRHLAPRGTRVHDPEQALEQTSMVQGGAAARRLLRGQEGRDLLPETVSQCGRPREHCRQWRVSVCRPWLARGAPCDMPPTGAGLVAAPPGHPVQRHVPARLGLGQEQQQAPDLRKGQGDAVVVVVVVVVAGAGSSPPFPSSAALWRAVRRVTSSAAWASRASVT